MPVDPKLLAALSVPLGDVITSIGKGVADAQRDLDFGSLAALREIYGSDQDLFRELQALGYRPTWYHIPEAEGEIQMVLNINGVDTPPDPGAAANIFRKRLYVTPIEAGYTSRYNFQISASSRVKFKIVPVPPSSAAEAIRVVPSVLGLQLSEGEARLGLLGIEAVRSNANAEPTSKIEAQTPGAGVVLSAGQKVELKV